MDIYDNRRLTSPTRPTWGQGASELAALTERRAIAGMEELEAAAAVLAVDTELEDEAAAAPLDTSTTSLTEMDTDVKGETNSPSPRSHAAGSF